MEPIPETDEALRMLDFPGSGLRAVLHELARRVREVVPDCVGMSVARLEHGLVFTLVATDEEIAILDAYQYLAGGPCVDAVEAGGEVVETSSDELLEEGTWQLFARATAASGVASTLTLPIVEAGEVVGSVNLYGASGNAFTGHRQALAEIVGGRAEGAVVNADLSFETRQAARKAPQTLRERYLVDVAAGVLAARLDIDVDEATQRLAEAAQRAGLPEVVLAAVILDHEDG